MQTTVLLSINAIIHFQQQDTTSVTHLNLLANYIVGKSVLHQLHFFSPVNYKQKFGWTYEKI